MASPSGTSSGSTTLLLQNSGSDEDLQQLMDKRKRKRMISNRESARRSRMRKQKHLDDLTAQAAQLRKENNEIITTINVTTQQFLTVESDNSILRAQVAELSHRLESLNEIIGFLNVGNGYFGSSEHGNGYLGNYTEQSSAAAAADPIDGFLNNSWSYLYLNQPMVASADLLQY